MPNVPACGQATPNWIEFLYSLIRYTLYPRPDINQGRIGQVSCIFNFSQYRLSSEHLADAITWRSAYEIMGTTILSSRRHQATGNFKIKALLFCGIAASCLYAAMLTFIPMLWKEYSSQTQTVSELSAIGSPTRAIWYPIGLVYTLLMSVFGYGVWSSANKNKPLRFVGVVLMIYGIIGIYWPPMHLRGEPTTLTDSLHIVWTVLTVLLMTIAIAVGAAAFDKLFKYYSIATVVLLLIFGFLTSSEAPNVPKNLPTPWIGIWERINIGVFLLWVLALSASVLTRMHSPTKKAAQERADTLASKKIRTNGR